MTQNKFSNYNKYFSDIENQIIIDIENSKFKNTLKIIYRKSKIIEDICNTISSNFENLYICQILQRSLIEHYLLIYYLYIKNKIEDTDNIGTSYYELYAESEFFKQESYSLQLEDIRNEQKKTINIEILKDFIPNINHLTQADLENYHKEAGQFTNLKKLGEFLLQNKNMEPKLEAVSSSIFDLLEYYNVLSSFVHGGPYAERIFFNEQEDKIFSHPLKILYRFDIAFYMLRYA